jgi:hypothetical protein
MIATPSSDGPRVGLRGNTLLDMRGPSMMTITTLRAAAELLGIELTADVPFVGDDLPPFEPDRDLQVNEAASLALAKWFQFGQVLLDTLRATVWAPREMSDAKLWPEHFDLAVTITNGERGVNVGVSPGDSFSDDPYLYVGPWDTSALSGPPWNAPFGAVLTRTELAASRDPKRTAAEFFATALAAAPL